MDKGGSGAGDWRVVHERGAAGALHAASAAALNDPVVVRTARFCEAERPALVLGSNQDQSVFDPGRMEAAGVDLARRRSGGSAVLVGAGRVLWLDLVIPSGDPLWHDDVGRAAWWVGDLWASVIEGAAVWRGPMRSNAWSAVVCFAGLGPGEVTVGGGKVVGVCQRRTPRGVLFQTAAVLEWAPVDYLDLLAVPAADPEELERCAVGIGRGAAEHLRSALVDRLDAMIS